MASISIRRKPTGFILLSTAVLAAILGLAWTGSSTLEGRIVTMRYFLFVLTALSAFLTPYLLFPDKNTPLIQLGNLGKKSLQQYVFVKFGTYFWPVFFLMAVMLFGDFNNPLHHIPLKIYSFLSACLLFLAIGMLSVARYVKSGPSSQFWKESQKGRNIRQMAADYLKYPIDPGSIPSLINTMVILVIGSAAIILAVYLGERVHPLAELMVFLSLSVYAALYLHKFSGSFVRDFYSSNSFFREFFGVNMKGEEVLATREVNQLWWVPGFIRMHVWQFLVQLDRIIPAGRAVAAGHLVVLFIAYQRPDPQFLVIIWIIFALLHQLFTLLTFRLEIAPRWLLRWVAPAYIWFLSRFWMQMRWVLPLFLGMNVQYFLFGTPDITNQAVIIVTFLISAFFVSAFGLTKTFNGANS